MRRLIEGLGTQMAEALNVPVTRLLAEAPPFRGVVVLGMGGSGIGGSVLGRHACGPRVWCLCRRCPTRAFLAG